MSSFKQLTKDGVLKRADAYKVQYQDIVVEPGFNTRDEGERLEAHVQAIFQFIMGGGQVPALEVVPTADGKVQVVDGHCRYRAYGLAIDAGAPIEWIDVRQFAGNDVDRTARIVSSNEGLQLAPLEVARVYKRLRGYGLGPDDIGKRVGKTRQHVDQLLILADAPHAVQRMVAAGEVSATLAIQMVRTHGDAAEDKLRGGMNHDKGKVTAKTVKPWTPPAKVVAPVVTAVGGLIDTLTADEHRVLNAIRNGERTTDTVMISGTALLALVDNHAIIEEERSKAAQKAREKAAKAAQKVIE